MHPQGRDSPIGETEMTLRAVPQKRPVADQVVDRITDGLEQNIAALSNANAIDSLRQIFIAKRLNSASAIEELRLKSVQILLEHIKEIDHRKINPAMLTTIIKALSEVNGFDLNIATGNSANSGINLYNVINNRSAAVAMGGTTAAPIDGDRATSSTIQDIGSLLEAITSIADGVKRNPRLIDGNAKDLDPSNS